MPFVMALVFGTMWALLYFVFGRMHAMWPMFTREFPFVLPSLIGVQKETMSPIAGMLYTFVDGALVAFALSGVLTLFMRNRWRGSKLHTPRHLTIFVTAGFIVLFAIVARGCPH